MKRNLIFWFSLFFVFILSANATPEKIIFPGSLATTGPGGWSGMAGKVYPIAFNVDSGKLTLIVYGLNMTGVKYTKVNPCCGPEPGAGLGAYAQVGVAGDRRLIDWPENGVQMLLTSVIGWDPLVDGIGAWNNQGAKYTHDSTRGEDDGLGYRKFLQQGWYNPINTLDPRDPWDSSFNQWNFQYNAEKYYADNPECQTFDLKLEVFKINDTPPTYTVQWWVRLHKAASWDETNRTANWYAPWNGTINNAAMGTADLENDGTVIDEVPAETGRVNGAWYRIKSPQTPGNPYCDITNVDFSKVFPHIGIHNGGNSANEGHTIYWESLSVEGETYPGKISVAPDSYDYLGVNVGSTKSQIFVVENKADDANLKVTNMYIAGANAGDFYVESPLDFTLGPGEKRNVVVNFLPLFQGLRTAEFKIESNDIDNPVIAIPLRGTGIAVLADFAVQEAIINWQKKAGEDKIFVKGTFKLSADSNGVKPTDNVTVVIGNFTPAPITMKKKGPGWLWEYRGGWRAKGIKEMIITWRKNEADFIIHVDDVELGDKSSWQNPVTISLQIGDDKGTTSIQMREYRNMWWYHRYHSGPHW
jgi:hypothetical protein